MKLIEKQQVLDVLNSLEVIEENGGEDAYILVKNDENNKKLLNEVGITTEIIEKYGDGETFCILALAFNERYADLYYNSELIAFDKSFAVELEHDEIVILYNYDGKYHIMVSKDDGKISTVELTNEQLQEIKNVID